MSSKNQPIASPLSDAIPKVDDAVSVGEDLDFQRSWWRFEKIAWAVLALVLVADALGIFGRGWLARAEKKSPDASIDLRYERVERTGTPSEMMLVFGPTAIHDGKIQLFSSESVVKELGAQRVIPQPINSEIGPRGITYTFPTSGIPATVSIALEPSIPGIHHIELRVPGSPSVQARIVVLP